MPRVRSPTELVGKHIVSALFRSSPLFPSTFSQIFVSLLSHLLRQTLPSLLSLFFFCTPGLSVCDPAPKAGLWDLKTVACHARAKIDGEELCAGKMLVKLRGEKLYLVRGFGMVAQLSQPSVYVQQVVRASLVGAGMFVLTVYQHTYLSVSRARRRAVSHSALGLQASRCDHPLEFASTRSWQQ